MTPTMGMQPRLNASLLTFALALSVGSPRSAGAEAIDVYHEPLAPLADSTPVAVHLKAELAPGRPQGAAQISFYYSVTKLQARKLAAFPTRPPFDPSSAICLPGVAEGRTTYGAELSPLNAGDLITYYAAAGACSRPAAPPESLLVTFAVSSPWGDADRKRTYAIPIWWVGQAELARDLALIPEWGYILTRRQAAFMAAVEGVAREALRGSSPASEPLRRNRDRLNLWIAPPSGYFADDKPGSIFEVTPNLAPLMGMANVLTLLHERSRRDSATIALPTSSLLQPLLFPVPFRSFWRIPTNSSFSTVRFEEPPGHHSTSLFTFLHETGHALFGQSDEFPRGGRKSWWRLELNNVYGADTVCKEAVQEFGCEGTGCQCELIGKPFLRVTDAPPPPAPVECEVMALTKEPAPGAQWGRMTAAAIQEAFGLPPEMPPSLPAAQSFVPAGPAGQTKASGGLAPPSFGSEPVERGTPAVIKVLVQRRTKIESQGGPVAFKADDVEAQGVPWVGCGDGPPDPEDKEPPAAGGGPHPPLCIEWREPADLSEGLEGTGAKGLLKSQAGRPLRTVQLTLKPVAISSMELATDILPSTFGVRVKEVQALEGRGSLLVESYSAWIPVGRRSQPRLAGAGEPACADPWLVPCHILRVDDEWGVARGELYPTRELLNVLRFRKDCFGAPQRDPDSCTLLNRLLFFGPL